jgi:hypothetical protein
MLFDHESYTLVRAFCWNLLVLFCGTAVRQKAPVAQPLVVWSLGRLVVRPGDQTNKPPSEQTTIH